MGLFGIHQKKVVCPRQVWTTIIRDFGTGLPTSIKLTCHANTTGEPIAGTYLELRNLEILTGKPGQGQLKENLSFQRRWSDAFYVIKVCPHTDITIHINP